MNSASIMSVRLTILLQTGSNHCSSFKRAAEGHSVRSGDCLGSPHKQLFLEIVTAKGLELLLVGLISL